MAFSPGPKRDGLPSKNMLLHMSEVGALVHEVLGDGGGVAVLVQ